MSQSEEEAKVGTKEEEELGILQIWMEMGGLLTLDEVEEQKLLWEVGSLFLSDIYMAFLLSCYFLVSIFHFQPFISFSRGWVCLGG